MDVRAALAEQGAQVGGHEVPTEEVLLPAVGAVDGDAFDALGRQGGPELGEFGEVGQHVLALVVAQRLRDLRVVEQAGRVVRVVQEGVQRAVVEIHHRHPLLAVTTPR